MQGLPLNEYWSLNKTFNAPFEDIYLNVRGKNMLWNFFTLLHFPVLLTTFYLVISVIVRTRGYSPRLFYLCPLISVTKKLSHSSF